MTDTTQEPTMEEILASIRRIISEDEPSGAAPAETTATGAASRHEEEGEVLELTHKVEPTTGGDLGGVESPEFKDETEKGESTETVGDLDVFDAAPTPSNQISSASTQAPADSPPAPARPQPQLEPKSGSAMTDQPLVGEQAAQAAASRFGALEQSVQPDHGVAMPSGQTMDQVIRDMLNPMLKAWLDTHLEKIVDAKVQAEVERISRRR